ncbi:uncharacterized protein LOC134238928 [Saccostrea cucullata]|uniref:uncharacterized protein LOC134238928 n=1 Tax=Saccostrea cuccullata TaxID=36930 RepID=UPI002ED01CBD
MTDSMSTNLTCLRKRYKSGRFRPKIKSVPIPTSEAIERKTEVSRMDHDYSRPPNHGKNIMSTSIDEGWSEYDEEDEDELDTSDEDYRGDDRNDDPPDETNEEDTLHPDVSKNLLDWHEVFLNVNLI